MTDLLSEPSELSRVVESIRRGEFSEADADRLLDLGRDAAKLVLLALAVRAASLHAPSSSTPGYEKPAARSKRAKPERIDARKNSYQNASSSGAHTQAVLMTVLMTVLLTLKRRGLNPLQALNETVAGYDETGRLSDIPATVAFDG